MKKNIGILLTGGGLAGLAGLVFLQYKMRKSTKNAIVNSMRLKNYYDVLSVWLDMKRSKRDFSEFFESYGIKTVAIYGMGDLGIHLYNDLQEQKNVEVKYCIDNLMKNREMFSYDIITTDDLEDAPEVDAIIVTPMHAFIDVEKLLQPYNCNIISLKELFYI